MSKNRQDTAVARIQALQRGRVARISDDRRRRSLDRRETTARCELEQAAIKIQAACRGARNRTERRARCREQQIAGAPRMQAANKEDKAREEASRAFPGGGSLSLTEIKKGLHTLGRNPHDMRHCYVGLMAANAGVFDINAIANFPLLQNVDLSENHISSVKPLSRLPFLQDLDISHNCLTSLLDYELFEGEDFSWRASEECLNDWRSEVVRSESMLHRVNASFNSITSIGDLTHHRNLQELDLSHNSVEVLQGLSALKCLRILKLSHNIIRRIEGLDDLPLVELELDHNTIERVENVGTDKLPNLRVLRLGFNSILSLSDLTNCQLLAILDVRFNKISAVRQVEYLQGCLNLHTLVLEGNPMEHLEAYRARVIFRLQGLTLLDRNKIPPEEKVKAVNLMGEDDSELPHRKQVFERFLPGAKFTNSLPPFCESEGPPELEEGTPEDGDSGSLLGDESSPTFAVTT
ncbi:unnamed protein product [Ascophyllum nodosum]